jgi:light-regulated signal transduction histidine kinase (bacteriophytochrome)
MRLKNESHELELIASALRVISKGINHQGLAKTLDVHLPVCRNMVEIHGVRRWVDRKMVDGPTFALILPLRQSIQIPGRI